MPVDPTPLMGVVVDVEESGDGAASLGVQLSAHDVSVSVAVAARRDRRQILHGVRAEFAPGSFSALMGPSGAGKTTLLHALRTGRCTSGTLHANGAPYTKLARRLIVTVPQVRAARGGAQRAARHGRRAGAPRARRVHQDDILLPGLSPLEMLHYAAQLKLPPALGGAGRLARARTVLLQLGFTDEDMATRIGSVDERGLSGGQRKRVSIGARAVPSCARFRHDARRRARARVARACAARRARMHTALELLTNPPVLLVDEPTSGLDAKMAHDVVSILRALSREGRTVVCTVHQPSSRIFASFDQLLLLAHGRVACARRAAASAPYFPACAAGAHAHGPRRVARGARCALAQLLRSSGRVR